MIPLFFSGEEFNASFRSIPWADAHLYGGKEPGKGSWLYGTMLDWSELDDPAHRAMFEDVKKMIAVRKREAGILAVGPDQKEPPLMAVPHETDIDVPVPYLCWNQDAALLVAGNLDTKLDAHLKMEIPLLVIGLAGHAHYKITDLWPGGKTIILTARDMTDFACTVRRDRTPGGGLRVFKIEANP
jgi:hypothetical protein